MTIVRVLCGSNCACSCCLATHYHRPTKYNNPKVESPEGVQFDRSRTVNSVLSAELGSNVVVVNCGEVCLVHLESFKTVSSDTGCNDDHAVRQSAIGSIEGANANKFAVNPN